MSDRRKLRITVAFDGTGYYGWQVQTDRPTVQGTLSEAIRQITGDKPNLVGSGRTDAGTHARALIASFGTRSAIPAASIPRALNSVLPFDIRVLSARDVSWTFDARRCAVRKRYRYQIYRGPIMPPHLAREHFHYPYRICLEPMRSAAALLIGEHDFAAFAAAGAKTEGRSTVRTIYRCDLRQSGFRLLLTVEGNRFLQHMVRNIAGTLLEVGRGRMKPEHMLVLFQERERRLAGFTAPAHGLILVKVVY